MKGEEHGASTGREPLGRESSFEMDVSIAAEMTIAQWAGTVIAGCKIDDGTIRVGEMVRVMRPSGESNYDICCVGRTRITTVRHHQSTVAEVCRVAVLFCFPTMDGVRLRVLPPHNRSAPGHVLKFQRRGQVGGRHRRATMIARTPSAFARGRYLFVRRRRARRTSNIVLTLLTPS